MRIVRSTGHYTSTGHICATAATSGQQRKQRACGQQSILSHLV